MVNITELKRAADIREIWVALGGGELRGNRGQAFWRGGDGYNVSLDVERGIWHDFVSGAGGDVIALIQAVQQSGFKEAVAWLANCFGINTPEQKSKAGLIDSNWTTDLKWAKWWSITAEAMAETTLESLPVDDPERRGLTEMLRGIRLSSESLVNEYREWRRRYPELTMAMTRAGQLSDARLQRRLAHWIRRQYGPSLPRGPHHR
jgi:hypothetical protein